MQGVERVLEFVKSKFPEMDTISLSGNFCTDKKPAAINWLEGRGKSVVCEATVPAQVVKQVCSSVSKGLSGCFCLSQFHDLCPCSIPSPVFLLHSTVDLGPHLHHFLISVTHDLGIEDQCGCSRRPEHQQELGRISYGWIHWRVQCSCCKCCQCHLHCNWPSMLAVSSLTIYLVCTLSCVSIEIVLTLNLHECTYFLPSRILPRMLLVRTASH